MSVEPTSAELQARWQRNEAELKRFHSLSGLGRESFGARIDELEAEQDAIDFDLGRDEAAAPGSRRWSGLP